MDILLPVGLFAASLAVGLLLQALVSLRFRALAQKTAARWDDVLVRALRGVIIAWSILLGLSLALRVVMLAAETDLLLQRIIAMAAILTATVFALRLASGLMTIWTERLTGVPTTLFKNIASIVVFVLGALVALDYLGVSITPLITALGVGGLAVALALQETLSNLFAGIHILATKKIRPGDYIRLDTGDEGTVADITWRNTVVRTLANNLVIVPNSKLAAAVVTNYDLPEKELALIFQVQVAYDTDLQRAETVVIEVARGVMAEVEGGIPGFEPFIRYHTFGPEGVLFSVIVRGRAFVDQYLLKHEFIKRLHARFRREGIVIPVPVREVVLRDGKA
jgi:small-conductance mechanosensitive channel